ncbi:PP2C family serine/threonine-protein phosphatase [Bacillus sp. FJAT-50079]|uniref:PP2C family serine/threonine-protein phosphatase n=1 Tax=Bacillus sp. FJAT-50079 TaxID=2833577 RepID=UPI001BC9947E|nr:PP2C family serine/threonine-protein phosphatase [Bacillus sp. FJAT-50079]MBS4206466.1 SpoIIE family protein phosphatase [Bacillus sp. FJAT-50079]
MMYLNTPHLEVHSFQTAKGGNTYCGDSIYMEANNDFFVCILADGLGSGEFAYEASQAAVSIVEANPEKCVDALIDDCNKAMVGKRGAAVAILKVDFQKKQFEYSCVGNIRFYVYPPAGKMIYPMPVTGYLSGRRQRFRTQTYPFDPKSRFLIHSDGFVNVNTRALLTSEHSITILAQQLKEKQIDAFDDMSFIVGNLL